MNFFSFHLPVKTYLKKYLTTQYGDPIMISLNSDIGFVILSTITCRLDLKDGKGNIDIWQNRYDNKICFRIPFHYYSISKKEVSPLTYVLVNRFFENKFKEDLCKYVEYHRQLGVPDKKCIENFVQKYGIISDVDISFDALKKIEYRQRQKLTEKLSRDLSPQSMLFQKTG